MGGLISRLDMAEENTGEPENESAVTTKRNTQKRLENYHDQSINEPWHNFRHPGLNIYIFEREREKF
jgi:hypothetical protein